MKTKIRGFIKETLAVTAYYSGVYRSLARTHGGIGSILMLHRVAAPGQTIFYPRYMVSVDELDTLLYRVRALGWEAVSVDEAHRRLHHGHTGSRFVCFTFDDGYLDNLKLALPVFRKHNAPLSVNITTGLLDRTALYWWGGLEELVRRTEVIDVPSFADLPGIRLTARTFTEKREAYDALDALCHTLQPLQLEAFTQELFTRYGVDANALLDRDAMTVAQARELSQDSLVTIGAHGLTHRRLSHLDDNAAWLEIEQSKRLLETWLETPVEHFAFPFGGRDACGLREFEFAKKAGFKTAVTTRRGNIFPEHVNHCECLPRRGVPISRTQCWNALYGYESIERGLSKIQTV
jgi:peptidoglycan/xylan/chitin deacetylase (PgdA/CDA1 family)